MLVLAAALLASTGLLVARGRAATSLAAAAGAVAAVAAALGSAGIWTRTNNDPFLKLIAATWILAALAYLLVPVARIAEHEPAG